MDKDSIEITALTGWLRTFHLANEVSVPDDLCDGLLLAEALVQIEPSVFTPAWYAGLVQNKKTNYENLTSVLNLLLHYYRHNLSDLCIPEDLPVPELSPDNQNISTNTLIKFLKLMLGVSVTCSNKQTFIGKIQSLDETAQHALTSCVASFIYNRDWTGRISQLSSTPDIKATTPPGDEIWAQKCHELDFQVAMLKEERANLISENEELYGKVRNAQTLSRKDSIKTREFERELAHIRDECERLRLAYEGTKSQLQAMEVQIRSSSQDDDLSLIKLAEETAILRTELGTIREEWIEHSQGSGYTDGRISGDTALAVELSLHSQDIQEIKGILSLQAGLVQEVDCLKDQVDILREQNHNQRNYEQELTDIRSRLSELNSSNRLSNLEWGDLTKSSRRLSDTNELGRNGQNRTLLSLESESCLTLDRLEAMEVDKSNEDMVGCLPDQMDSLPDQVDSLPDQVDSLPDQVGSLPDQMGSLPVDVNGDHAGIEKNLNVDETDVVHPTKLNLVDTVHEQGTNEDLNDTDDDVEQLEDESPRDHYFQKVESRHVQSSSSTTSQSYSSVEPFTSERISFKEIDDSESRNLDSATDFTSPEVDSGLETTTSENTPFASRPESELVLPYDKFDEDDVQPNPMQLEKLLEESGASADSSPRGGTSPLLVQEEPSNMPKEETNNDPDNTIEDDAYPRTPENDPNNTIADEPTDNTTASDHSNLSASEESTAIDTTSFNVKDEITKIEARLNTSDDSDIEAFEPSLTSEPLETTGEDNTSRADDQVQSADNQGLSADTMQVNNDDIKENAIGVSDTEIKADSMEHQVIATSEDTVLADETIAKEEAVAVGEAVMHNGDVTDLMDKSESDADEIPSPKSLKSGVEAAHESVEEIISEIQDPDLDSSLEDIQAMVEEAKSELSDKTDDESAVILSLPAAVVGGAAGAAIAVGAGLIDPEDPKVKELEEWELKSHHDKSLHLDDEAYARILGLRRSKTKPLKTKPLKMEERRLLEEMERDDNYTTSNYHNNKFDLTCVGSWLVRILIKIFD